MVCTFRSKLAGIPENYHEIVLALLLHLLKELLKETSNISTQQTIRTEQATTSTSEEKDKIAADFDSSEKRETIELISKVLLALVQGCKPAQLSTLLSGLTNDLVSNLLNAR